MQRPLRGGAPVGVRPDRGALLPQSDTDEELGVHLTELGRSLLGLVRALEAWAKPNMGAVPAARASYDARDQAYSAK